jgi:hypothetical protein
MIRPALTETIEITNRVPADISDVSEYTSRYGDPIDVDEDAVSVRCSVQPLDATETEIGRDVRISRYRVIVEPTVSVDGLSRVTWRDREFEIIGEPKNFVGPLGAYSREFDMREIEG